MTDRLVAYCDGGARGNPGPAALGVSIQTPDGDEVDAIAEFLGEDTNNVAEYSAVLAAVRRAAALGARKLRVISDSQLVVEQLNGRYKIKQPHLQRLALAVRDAARALEEVTFEHVARAGNARADALVNEALDSAAKGP